MNKKTEEALFDMFINGFEFGVRCGWVKDYSGMKEEFKRKLLEVSIEQPDGEKVLEELISRKKILDELEIWSPYAQGSIDSLDNMIEFCNKLKNE